MDLFKLQYWIQQWRYSAKARGRPPQVLYEQSAIGGHQQFSKTKFLVVDCEMSGLNAARDNLLSIGWVLIDNERIVSASGKHLLIQSDAGAGNSSKIHGLLDSNLAGAKSIASVLLMLIKEMQGCVLVFHHAPIDLAFLQKAARENFHCPMLFGYLDTMGIEYRRFKHKGSASIPSLRLADCRKRYGLPQVKQHNALMDAFATAELLLAQASVLSCKGSLSIGDLGLACAI